MFIEIPPYQQLQQPVLHQPPTYNLPPDPFEQDIQSTSVNVPPILETNTHISESQKRIIFSDILTASEIPLSNDDDLDDGDIKSNIHNFW
jgi:hypothetical protein